MSSLLAPHAVRFGYLAVYDVNLKYSGKAGWTEQCATKQAAWDWEEVGALGIGNMKAAASCRKRGDDHEAGRVNSKRTSRWMLLLQTFSTHVVERCLYHHRCCKVAGLQAKSWPTQVTVQVLLGQCENACMEQAQKQC